MSVKNAVYAMGCLYPATSTKQPIEDTVVQLQTSGFNVVILGLFHIAGTSAGQSQQAGDLSFNDTPVISDGIYVGDPSWPGLVAQLRGGSVETVCASIGGGGVADFANLAEIYADNGGSYVNTHVEANFSKFRTMFPTVTIIDIDCEEGYDHASLVAFCQMLAGMGFGITFCPYIDMNFWTDVLQAVEITHRGAVRWWNLQCYAGGSDNSPQVWAEAITQALPEFDTDGFIVAGDWTTDSTSKVTTLLQSFEAHPCLGGGFLWKLDDLIPTARGYANAIATGLRPVTHKPPLAV